jgi:hypothetical protein
MKWEMKKVEGTGSGPGYSPIGEDEGGLRVTNPRLEPMRGHRQGE